MVVLKPQFDLSIKLAEGAERRVRALRSARVQMTRKKPVDTCALEFPYSKEFTFDLFHEGDEVTLTLGFAQFGLHPVFLGEVKEVGLTLPFRLTCQSVAAASRKNPYTKTYTGASWKDIASDALTRAKLIPKAAEAEPPTQPPNKFRVNGQTPAQVLDICARENGWVWYAIPGTNEAYFGPRLEELPADASPYLFTVGGNVYADDCDLEYVDKERIKKVVVTLVDADYKLPAATGEHASADYQEGDVVKKLKFPVSAPTKEKAARRAAEEYARLAALGFRGSFRAIGNPLVRQGSCVSLSVPQYDDNVRRATVESVEHVFEDGVYEMFVEITGSGG